MAKKKSKNKDNIQRSMVYKVEGETIYGEVEKALGIGRFEVICSDTVKRTCKIRGSLYKRVWIQPGDIILICFREGFPDKGDIIHKYFPHEVKELRRKNEIPQNFSAEEVVASGIEFETSKL